MPPSIAQTNKSSCNTKGCSRRTCLGQTHSYTRKRAGVTQPGQVGLQADTMSPSYAIRTEARIIAVDAVRVCLQTRGSLSRSGSTVKPPRRAPSVKRAILATIAAGTIAPHSRPHLPPTPHPPPLRLPHPPRHARLRATLITSAAILLSRHHVHETSCRANNAVYHDVVLIRPCVCLHLCCRAGPP
jgi:hypothetical protein